MRCLLPVFSLLALSPLGCGGTRANCEVEVNGVTVCIDGNASVKYCKQEWGGKATPASSSSDPSCKDMGYSEECEGEVTQTGEITGPTATGEFTGYESYFAESVEDCEAADGGKLGG